MKLTTEQLDVLQFGRVLHRRPGTMKPSRKWIDGLKWIAAREPVGWFDASAPTMVIVKRLRDYGLIEEAGREPGALSPTRYRVTQAGRNLMASHS